GTNRSVTSVITPKVPSLPTNNCVSSSPATSFNRGPPNSTCRPSASTTFIPSTLSDVTPYFTQHNPPALVAILPPIEQNSTDDGSGGYHRPCSAAATLTSELNAPG